MDNRSETNLRTVKFFCELPKECSLMMYFYKRLLSVSKYCRDETYVLSKPSTDRFWVLWSKNEDNLVSFLQNTSSNSMNWTKIISDFLTKSGVWSWSNFQLFLPLRHRDTCGWGELQIQWNNPNSCTTGFI